MSAAGAPTIRRARRDEALPLSALALRSKAHWGYTDAFLESSRAELSIAVDDIEGGDLFVAEHEGRVLGFYALGRLSAQTFELDHLFVEPDAIGGGYGAALFEHACERARSAGASVLLIQSDPHAEGFYRRRGAERVGERESDSVPGRMLPLLERSLVVGG